MVALTAIFPSAPRNPILQFVKEIMLASTVWTYAHKVTLPVSVVKANLTARSIVSGFSFSVLEAESSSLLRVEKNNFLFQAG
jgi:hypothetical protein